MYNTFIYRLFSDEDYLTEKQKTERLYRYF